MEMSQISVLLIEPMQSKCDSLSQQLQGLGFEQIRCCQNGEQALESLQQSPSQLVIGNLYLADLSGAQLMQRVRSQLGQDAVRYVWTTNESVNGLHQQINANDNAIVLPRVFTSAQLGGFLRRSFGGILQMPLLQKPSLSRALAFGGRNRLVANRKMVA